MRTWKRNSLAHLVLALVVLATPVVAQDLGEFMNCEICSAVFQDMELIAACDYAVHDWSHGTVTTLELNNPAFMQKLRDFEKHDKAMCAKFMNMTDAECGDKLCGGCADYFKFRRKGLEEERIETPKGTIVLTRTSDPALLKEVHSWSARMREMMASFDPAAFGAPSAKTESCCGTCSTAEATCSITETACSAKATCSSEGTCSLTAEKSADCCGTCTSASTCTADAAEAGKAAMAMIPPAMLEEMKKCALCTLMMEQPEMMFAAKPEVVTLKTGVVFSDTVIDKANVKKYHAFQTKFHDRIEELKVNESWESAKGKVCSFCWKFAELDEAGAIIDWSCTDGGTVTVITSKEPAVVEKIHALAEEVKACCEMFELM